MKLSVSVTANNKRRPKFKQYWLIKKYLFDLVEQVVYLGLGDLGGRAWWVELNVKKLLDDALNRH